MITGGRLCTLSLSAMMTLVILFGLRGEQIFSRRAARRMPRHYDLGAGQWRLLGSDLCPASRPYEVFPGGGVIFDGGATRNARRSGPNVRHADTCDLFFEALSRLAPAEEL